MSGSPIIVQPVAQAASTKVKFDNPWMISSGVLLILLVGLGIFFRRRHSQTMKKLRFAEFKNRELQKRMQRALKTITKMERNPDLIHSREFNLDYLRMRMEEERFHFAIVNQLKIKVKQQMSVALRPKQAETGMIGVASKPRPIDETFDITYAASSEPGAKQRVLFRIRFCLAKLPSQSTSSTVNQIIDIIESFLGPDGTDPNWQPTLQGRIAYMHWDQKAKPTPLLVLEQSNEGVNVTLRSRNRLPSSKAS